MLYSEEGTPSTQDNQRLFFSFKEDHSPLVSYTTRTQRDHTCTFHIQGWTRPHSEGEAAGNSKFVPGNLEYGIPFQIPEGKPWQKAGNMRLKPHHWEGDWQLCRLTWHPLHMCTYKHTLLWVMSLCSRALLGGGCWAWREKNHKYLTSVLWPCL